MISTLYFALAVDVLLVATGFTVAYMSYRSHERKQKK